MYLYLYLYLYLYMVWPQNEGAHNPADLTTTNGPFTHFWN